MTRHYVVGSLTLKQFLWLVAAVFAGAATLLTLWFTSAATETGSRPSLAISLVEGDNTGVLGAQQERWFRLMPASPSDVVSLEQTLALNFTLPGASLEPALSLQLFEGKAAPSPQDDNIATLTSQGMGQPVLDRSGQTVQVVWQGQLSPDRTYYILLNNQTDFPLDYRLFAQQRPLSPPPVVVEPSQQPVPVSTLPSGQSFEQATVLRPGLNGGKLKAYSRYWYTFTESDPANPERFHTRKFTLFFTPDDGQRRHHVNFELFTSREVERWWRGEEEALLNFGAGMLLDRDGDPNTGERLWRGTVMNGETYFLVIENGTETEIDYWLFDDDVEHPELGVKP